MSTETDDLLLKLGLLCRKCGGAIEIRPDKTQPSKRFKTAEGGLMIAYPAKRISSGLCYWHQKVKERGLDEKETVSPFYRRSIKAGRGIKI